MTSEDRVGGPLLLLGYPGAALRRIAGRFSSGRVEVVTADEDLEERAGALRPSLVLLDAVRLYLDGRDLEARLRARCPETRIVFLEIGGPSAILLEYESSQTGDLLVTPCELESLGEAVRSLAAA